MKLNFLHIICASALLLTACSEDDGLLPGADNISPLSVTVTDGGYISETGSRAAENGYTTEFTPGDACGLYIIRNGVAVYDNVKLTAAYGTDGTLAWQPESGVTIAGGMPGERYFLYYPYQEDMSGKTDAAATDDEGFFASLISSWQPAADQSDYATGYTASDLMTATGTAAKADGKLSLNFAMTHRMALAVIELPKTVYKFTDTSISDYVVPTSVDFVSDVRPHRMSDGSYRLIVNPGNSVTVSGTYAEGMREFSLSPNGINEGSCKTYKVVDAQTVNKTHNLQTGDYLLADGSLVGKDETLTDKQKADCIAIVFQVGHDQYDRSDYSSSGIGSERCHGYAVALQDASPEYCNWGVEGVVIGNFPTDANGNPQDNYTNGVDEDWSGYRYTQNIIRAAGGKDKLNATEPSGYPATWHTAVNYQNIVASPVNSSGWFLPAIGQMKKVHQLSNLLTVSFSVELKMNSYWSSSEDFRFPTIMGLGWSVRWDYVFYKGKELSTSYVRAILAF